MAKIQAATTIEERPNIVVIGGGSGSANILKGLRQFQANISVIVTMFDSGGSSGLLRSEFGFPPFGDLRQCLLALANNEASNQALRDAFGFRFGNESSLNGHSVGNLILAALTTLSNDLETAIDGVAQILGVSGQVLPVTLERAELCANLEDGRQIRGESAIDLRGERYPRITDIFLDQPVKANPRALEAIRSADAIILGPGDLYTSILPNLLAYGMAEAIAESTAVRIYVSNLMTKPGETDGFTASDFVGELVRYMKPARLDWAVVNASVVSSSVQIAYENEGAYLVDVDFEEISKYVGGTIAAPLSVGELPLRHDPSRTAKAIFRAVDAGRLSQPVRSRSVPTVA